MIKLTVTNENESIKIDLHDNGQGMSEADVLVIYDEFHQAQDGGKSNKIGTGLGMSIAKSLTELLGGSLKVQSTLGQGTTFTLVIPREVVPQRSSSLKQSQETETFFNPDVLRDYSILVVEDTPLNQKLIQSYFKKLGLRPPLMARDGVEAIEIIRHNSPDIIFMDLLMPRLNGIETTRKIREDFPYNPVVVGLSANIESKDECINNGMDDFMGKPIEKDDLKRLLMSLPDLHNRKSA